MINFKWFDFQDKEFLILFIIVVALLTLLFGIILSFSLIKNSLHHYENKINQEKVTTQIFIIDPKNNSVLRFNRSDLRNKEKIDIGTFYSYFHEKDSERVKKWILPC